ncbi:Crp/Fnr family transcriptional regulator [Oceanibacterium hippocampi]|uniref:Crp/Fnr family transcriptional regulator n=1 Tax=Oceanibacterium hippocampi TaxID=745714 RepID=UPI00111C528B|nr:Crp/Fnr family transcriptional regulator [Oceanibacterium hippocampi]
MTDDDVAADVRQPDLFKSLTEIELDTVLARARLRKLTSDETLFLQGATHEGVFAIKSGMIRTYYSGPSGREITLAYWGPGNLVGTPEVLSKSVHVWSGTAVGPTEVYFFSGENMRQLISEIPRFAVAMIEALEFKGKCFSTLIHMLGTNSVPERLCLLLRNLVAIHGVEQKNGIVLGAPFTHEALAQMLGCSRQWVTISLDRLQTKGIVKVGNRSLLIRRPDLL